MKMRISHFDGQQYQYEECWDSEYYDRDIGWLIMPMNSMADAEADLGYSIIVPDAVEGYDPPQIYVEDNDLFGIDERSQLEMEAYFPELTCVTGEEPSTFTVECHGREGLISFAEWQHDGFAYAISTQYKPLSEEEMKELIYQIW